MIPLWFLGPRIQSRVHLHLYSVLKERYLFSRYIWHSLDEGISKIVIRVDDFPYLDVDNGEFLRFHEVMAALAIPYILGVTPFYEIEAGKERELGRDAARILKECEPLCTIALHGFSHRPYPEFKISDELDHYSEESVILNIARTRDKFKELGLDFPTALIAPFNAIGKSTFRIFGRYFRYIFTGEPALTTLGPLSLYERIGTTYNLPSYFPFYGSCAYMTRYLGNPFRWGKEFYVPLTIHWGLERDREYKAMKELLTALRDRIASFSEMKVWLDRKFPLDQA